MTALTLGRVWRIFWFILAPVQSASAQTSVLTFHLERPDGKAIEEGEIVITSVYAAHRRFVAPVVAGVAEVVVPYGSYLLKCCEHLPFAAADSFRVVHVQTERVKTFLRLNGLELAQVVGEGTFVPWTILGTTTKPQAAQGAFVRACRIGDATCADAAVDKDGKFEIPVTRLGFYQVLIIVDGDAVSTGNLFISRRDEKRLRVMFPPAK